MNKETPYFLFKEKKLEENYHEFENLCKKYIEKYIIAYSIKTNGFGAVINKLHELGSNFEVASMDEIMKTPEKAKIFNGAGKTEAELELAIYNKFLINADSKSEIDKIIKIVDGSDFNISLRISLSEEKFGIDLKQLKETIDYCFINNIKIIGLSFHPGTQKSITDYKEYIKKVEKVIEENKEKIPLKYIDLGGGFPDKLQLKNLSSSLEGYFKEIEKLKKFNLQIILEPGRYIVADAFELYSKVTALKEKNGKNYAILDIGINVLSKITLANYRFENIRKNEKDEEKDYYLAGPLLFGNDVLGKFKGNLKEGDILKVTNVGAYCYNLAWEISYKKPRVLVE